MSQFRDVSSALTWLLYCQRTKQSDGSGNDMGVYNSELEVANNFLHLSATDYERLSRLSANSLLRISTAFAASREQALQTLRSNVSEMRAAASHSGRDYGGYGSTDDKVLAAVRNLESRVSTAAEVHLKPEANMA